MKAIVVGSGGREHAIAWALAKSPVVEEVIVSPGNGGTYSENKCRNIEGESVEIAMREHCTLAVIGPEVPLAEGLSDAFSSAGILCVGASRKAAQLEASKDYAKAFMKKYGVASPASETFNDPSSAKCYIKKHGAPIVIKADGLAAGKGVTVAATEKDAIDAIDDIMLGTRLGEAGRKVVIEDYLEGVEMSVLAAVSVVPDGEGVIVPFLPARDHKRLMDGAQGPNTGGMGAVCPLQDVDDDTMASFDEYILQPTLQGLKAEGFDYRGFIFFGVMITASGPKLLEYNVRLGDPETQAVLPLMESDFAKLCLSIANGTLSSYKGGALKWKSGYVVSPCLVSKGYPAAYKKGVPITIDGVSNINSTPRYTASRHSGTTPRYTASGYSLAAVGVNNAADIIDSAKVFIAGAQWKDGTLFTSGGRVLCCSAYGKTFEEAREAAYKTIDSVHFDGAFYRTDIGMAGAATSGHLG